MIALAEATPQGNSRGGPLRGLHSTSEVDLHIAIANFCWLTITAPILTAGFNPELEKTVTSKTEVIGWLKLSLDSVQRARAWLKPGDLLRKVPVADRNATADGVYLRITIQRA